MKHLSLVYMMAFYRMLFGINAFRYPFKWKGGHQKHTHNKRLKRDWKRRALTVPLEAFVIAHFLALALQT